MATGTIPLFAQYRGVLTPKTGFDGNEYSVRRVGNIVVVKGYITKAGGIGASEVAVTTVSGVPIPSQTTRFTCSSGSNAYSATASAYGVISVSGEIKISVASANGAHPTVIFNFWYPIN